MKKMFGISVFLLALLFPIIVNGQVPDIYFRDKIPVPESESHVKMASYTESASAGETDLFYQRLEWSIDPAVNYISGKITSWFKVNSAEIDRITFDLMDNMQVDSVIMKKGKLNFTHSGNLLTISLKTSLPKNVTDSLSVYYRGQPNAIYSGSFVCSKHNGTPIIWTLSEPYGAREWWPCKQSLKDKIDSVDIFVTTPEQYRTASNGLVISDKIVNSKRVMHWKHRYPIATYLVAIGVTNYSVYTDTLHFSNGLIIPVLNYVYPENLDIAHSGIPATLDAIKLYSDLFGLYPFSKEKYGHAQFGWGGGMEHQTMSFVTNFGFGLLVHELSHSWFGDCITLSTWHDIWLNEGFATYAEELAYEKLKRREFLTQWKQSNLNNIISSPDGSVYLSDTTDINRIFNGRLSYSKGGYLLHMLRWKMGDTIFFRALRNYFSDSQLRYGFVSQQQLVSHLESVSGTSLTEFFKDWYYGEGYPTYSAIFRNISAHNFRIQLSQTSSHPSVPFFEMPVPVRAYSGGRKDSVDFRLEHLFNNQVFDLEAPFTVTEIEIDPDLWLIRKIDKVTKIENYDIDPGFSVVPNPSGGKWQIMTGNGEMPEKAGIFDMSGRLLFQQKMNGNVISATWLVPGIYILKVTTNKRVFETKLVKR